MFTKPTYKSKGISYMESIQQIAEKFINKIIETDICDGLTQGLETMKNSVDELICRIMEHKLTEMDHAIYSNRNLRRGWVVEQKNITRELLTRHGTIRFSRRYYRNRKNGTYKYLVDDLVGIVPGERIEAGLAAELCETATDNSYAKSAKLCCNSEVSRQTVMRKTRKVERLTTAQIELRPEVHVLHIQADEDHVAMQDGRRDTIVKMAAIHEPAQQVSKRRWQLPQRHIMSSYNEPVEDFWLRVADEIEQRYGGNEHLRIYIHGDGASWIRSGTKWLNNSYFVLDKFHVSQMLNRVTGHNVDYTQYIWDQLGKGNRAKVYEMVEACVDSEICAENTGKAFVQYIRNNWDGIDIWYDERHPVGGSCAEGLVSHVLSSRLSSRPCGWLDKGLETISRLRVHVLNGGRITPENIRQIPKPQIRVTKVVRKSLAQLYNEARTMHTDHRSSPEYRLFKAITNGGRAI